MQQIYPEYFSFILIISEIFVLCFVIKLMLHAVLKIFASKNILMMCSSQRIKFFVHYTSFQRNEKVCCISRLISLMFLTLEISECK